MPEFPSVPFRHPAFHPTRMIFGACRSMARMILRKIQPDLVPHLDLIHAGQVILDRILGCNDLACLGRFSSFRAAYRVVVLPDPVGPVTRMIPFGRRIRFLKLLESRVSDRPNCRTPTLMLSLSSNPHDGRIGRGWSAARSPAGRAVSRRP